MATQAQSRVQSLMTSIRKNGKDTRTAHQLRFTSIPPADLYRGQVVGEAEWNKNFPPIGSNTFILVRG